MGNEKAKVVVDNETLKRLGAQYVEGLTRFDKKVYETCAFLMRAGCEYASFHQVCEGSGISGRQLDKVKHSLRKMRRMPIKILCKSRAKEDDWTIIRCALLATEEIEREDCDGRVFIGIHFLLDEDGKYPLLSAEEWDSLLSISKEGEK